MLHSLYGQPLAGLPSLAHVPNELLQIRAEQHILVSPHLMSTCRTAEGSEEWLPQLEERYSPGLLQSSLDVLIRATPAVQGNEGMTLTSHVNVIQHILQQLDDLLPMHQKLSFTFNDNCAVESLTSASARIENVWAVQLII